MLWQKRRLTCATMIFNDRSEESNVRNMAWSCDINSEAATPLPETSPRRKRPRHWLGRVSRSRNNHCSLVQPARSDRRFPTLQAFCHALVGSLPVLVRPIANHVRWRAAVHPIDEKGICVQVVRLADNVSRSNHGKAHRSRTCRFRLCSERPGEQRSGVGAVGLGCTKEKPA